MIKTKITMTIKNYYKNKIEKLEQEIKEHKENIEALCDRLDYYENVQY